MVIIIIMFIVGIVLRWGWIKDEVSDAFRSRIERSRDQTDPGGIIEDSRKNKGKLEIEAAPTEWEDADSVSMEL